MTLPRNDRLRRCAACGELITNTEQFVGIRDGQESEWAAVYHYRCGEAAQEKVPTLPGPSERYTLIIGGTKYAPAPPESKKTRKLRWKGRP